MLKMFALEKQCFIQKLLERSIIIREDWDHRMFLAKSVSLRQM